MAADGRDVGLEAIGGGESLSDHPADHSLDPGIGGEAGAQQGEVRDHPERVRPDADFHVARDAAQRPELAGGEEVRADSGRDGPGGGAGGPDDRGAGHLPAR